MEKPKILAKTEREAIVYKPAGMATQLSDDTKGTSLESVLKKQLDQNEIFFPHRLDRVTRGLLLVCFNKETVAYYNDQIKARKFSKHYICRSELKTGEPEKLIGEHKRYLKTTGNKSIVVNSGGAPSFLEILVIEPAPRRPGQFHVLIKLITGRTHQIRVMLADLGIPLSGDHLYNPESRRKDFYLESLILKFTDTNEKEQNFFYEDNPDREVLNLEMKSKIDFLISLI